MIPDIFQEYFSLRGFNVCQGFKVPENKKIKKTSQKIDIEFISWTTQLYMVSFCIGVFPIIWWLDNSSVKVAHLMGAGNNALV